MIGVVLSAACALASCFSGGPTIVHETWSTYSIGSYFGDGATFGQWVEKFTGYGHAAIVDDPNLGRALEIQPRAPLDDSETHGALAITSTGFGDFDATVEISTMHQLRTPSPNRWETGWLLWHYVDGLHFYYFILEADGWELGKEDPAYPRSQRFLATGAAPTMAFGVPNAVRIVQSGATIFVYVNGLPVVRFVDGERPYGSGSLGLYCEDAQVRFGLIHVAGL